MAHVPTWLDAAFVLITLFTSMMFLRAAKHHRAAPLVLLIWAVIIGALGLGGFFLNTAGVPPRFALTIGLPVIFIIVLFNTARGRRFIDGLDPSMLVLLNAIRFPVELGLYGLFVHGAIPELMTFSGRNWDILSGLTAPLVWYFGYHRAMLPRWVLVGWNLGCLALLVNIVTHAILAAPFQFQQIAFERPNVGVLYFPYIWLPAIVVPLVLFSHLTLLRKLLRSGVRVERVAEQSALS
jgi:hypothetical protein